MVAFSVIRANNSSDHCLFYVRSFVFDRVACVPLPWQMCELIEIDGISSWVYSDGAVGGAHSPGLLQREIDDSSRRLVLAELNYSQRTWDDFI